MKQTSGHNTFAHALTVSTPTSGLQHDDSVWLTTLSDVEWWVESSPSLPPKTIYDKLQESSDDHIYSMNLTYHEGDEYDTETPDWCRMETDDDTDCAKDSLCDVMAIMAATNSVFPRQTLTPRHETLKEEVMNHDLFALRSWDRAETDCMESMKIIECLPTLAALFKDNGIGLDQLMALRLFVDYRFDKLRTKLVDHLTSPQSTKQISSFYHLILSLRTVFVQLRRIQPQMEFMKPIAFYHDVSLQRALAMCFETTL